MSGSNSSLSSGARMTIRATAVFSRSLFLQISSCESPRAPVARQLQRQHAAIVLASGHREDLVFGRPRRLVHGSRLPPGPDLLGRKRQKRREQTQEHRQGREQRGVGRGGRRLAVIAIAPRLHELEIVVAERPEERLGALEHASVLIVLQIVGRLAHEPREVSQQSAIDAARDGPARPGIWTRRTSTR